MRRRQRSAVAAGFWVVLRRWVFCAAVVEICSGGGFLGHCAAAAAKDHVDVDLGDNCVSDVELDEDLDVVVQLGVDVRLDVVPALLGDVDA